MQHSLLHMVLNLEKVLYFLITVVIVVIDTSDQSIQRQHLIDNKTLYSSDAVISQKLQFIYINRSPDGRLRS